MKDLTASPNAAWLEQRERGAVWAIRMVVLVANLFGRSLTRALVSLIALFYTIFDGTSRAASRAWLTRVHDRRPTFREIYRHIRTFSQVTLDRLFLASGKTGYFTFKRNGNEHLFAQAATRQGAILLGAHVGSFEAMRASGQEEKLSINIVGHFENAQMINSVLKALDPEMAERVIHIGDDPMGLALKLREQVEEGSFLALLADRVGLNDKWIEVEFMGKPAPFPTGPFLLASLLKCPVYLVFGLYVPPNHYELFCEPFSESIVLPRGKRDDALRDVVSRYARRLEDFSRRAPNNWFNFYDFWKAPQ